MVLAKVTYEDMPVYFIVQVDVAKHKEVGTKYDIWSYPTLKFFRNGVPKVQ